MLLLSQTEHAENVIIFVDRFAIVPALLLVPPVAVRVTMLPILSRRVDVAAVLGRGESRESVSIQRLDLMIMGGIKGLIQSWRGIRGVVTDHLRIIDFGLGETSCLWEERNLTRGWPQELAREEGPRCRREAVREHRMKMLIIAFVDLQDRLRISD